MSKYFIVENKADDYGNCKSELVYTSLKNAKEYYSYKEVPENHATILKEYIHFVNRDEEQQRSNEERFYGNE